MNYIRFTTNYMENNQYVGLFAAIGHLITSDVLEPYEEDVINDIFDWFNDELLVPPWSKNYWHEGLSWFKSSAHEFINRMWDLSHIIKEHDLEISVDKCENPGKVVYEDEYQVVAIKWEGLKSSDYRFWNS